MVVGMSELINLGILSLRVGGVLTKDKCRGMK